MTQSAAVLIGEGLSAQETLYRTTLSNAGYQVFEHNDQSLARHSGTVVVLLDASAAGEQIATWRARVAGIRPIVVGEAMGLADSGDLELAAAPVLATDATEDLLLRLVEFAGRDNGWLASDLARLDRTAEQLVADEVCQWVKARPGIIGVVRLAHLDAGDSSARIRQRLIAHAYALLDRLPAHKLSFHDIWNVALLIAVPLKRAEFDGASATAKVLLPLSRDLNGTRKLILWLDQSIVEYFGPLGEGHHLWSLSTDDPLRQKLDELAADSRERQAVEILFKGRISQEDVDDLIRVLSRDHDQDSHH